MATMHRVKMLLSGAALPGGGLATHYFDYPSSAAQTALDAATSLWGQFCTYMCPDLHVVADAIVDQVDPADGAIFGVTACSPESLAGASANDCITQASQMLVQWRTGQYLNGREVRGRTFVPGVTENYSTSGELAPAVLASLPANLDAFINASGAVPVIWHRPGPHGAGSAVPIALGTLWTEFAVLRGRR
jgi:hypothetical protein